MLPLHNVRPQPANIETVGEPHPSTMKWISKSLYALYALIFGIPLLYLPWSNSWENNYLLFLCPQIQPVISNPFFKGAVLGLGIANILIGVREVVFSKGMSKSCPPR